MMDTYVALLQTYSGRDKIVRTTGYTAMLLSVAVKGKVGQKLGIFARQLSSARTILRLFDDVPMWTLTRKWAASVGSKCLLLNFAFAMKIFIFNFNYGCYLDTAVQ